MLLSKKWGIVPTLRYVGSCEKCVLSECSPKSEKTSVISLAYVIEKGLTGTHPLVYQPKQSQLLDTRE